eukprot:1572652-Alexandrium_andersonii.AAC.1
MSIKQKNITYLPVDKRSRTSRAAERGQTADQCRKGRRKERRCQPRCPWASQTWTPWAQVRA